MSTNEACHSCHSEHNGDDNSMAEKDAGGENRTEKTFRLGNLQEDSPQVSRHSKDHIKQDLRNDRKDDPKEDPEDKNKTGDSVSKL